MLIGVNELIILLFVLYLLLLYLAMFLHDVGTIKY